MRAVYSFLNFILPYIIHLYFRRIKVINRPEKYLARTVFVCNHAAAFMDPFTIAGTMNPIVFFMTRSDVFTKSTKHLLWATQMLPIYRKQDKVDTKSKNDEVFDYSANLVVGGRSLIIFGEGFTDDIFVRRLKPLKKGAVRIGFRACENSNWKKKIYMQTSGTNYGDPNVVDSELVISHGKKICLNDYRAQYEENPEKVVNNLTQQLQIDLQNQISHVEEYDWAFFHEQVMRINRDGLDPIDADRTIPLLERYQHSKDFANWINQQDLSDENLMVLKQDLDHYFSELKAKKMADTPVYETVEKKQQIASKSILFWCWFPFTLLGLIHCYLPYKFVKNFTEKTFKRRVFWGSVKMMMGFAVIGIWNMLLVSLLHYFLIKPLCVGFEQYAWTISVLYFFLVPVFGKIAYRNFRRRKNILIHKKQRPFLQKMAEQRKSLKKRIDQLSFFSK